MTVTHSETTTEESTVVLDEEQMTPGDSVPDKRHMINPPMNTHIWREGMDTQDIVDIARVRGIGVRALCGKVFIPKHNVEGLSTCDVCVEIAGQIIDSESGE